MASAFHDGGGYGRFFDDNCMCDIVHNNVERGGTVFDYDGSGGIAFHDNVAHGRFLDDDGRGDTIFDHGGRGGTVLGDDQDAGS